MRHVKKQILKFSLFLLLPFLLLGLTACGGDKVTNDQKKGENGQNNGKISPDDLLNKKDRTWQETNGLFEVWEKNGDFYISYDLNKWEELYDFTAYLDEFYIDAQPGRLLSRVRLLEDKVKDVTIGFAENYSQTFDDDKEFPVIFFLLENGQVQWLKPMPEAISKEDGPADYQDDSVFEVFAFEPIVWMENIVSLAPGVITEGFGGQSIFATDSDGIRYDLTLPLDYSPLLNTRWEASIDNPESEYSFIFLEFLDQKRVSLFKLNKDAARKNLELNGTYEMYLDDSSAKGYRAPSIKLNFPGLSGVYMLGQENFFDPFFIFLSDGSPLETGVEEYYFYYSFDEDYN